MQNLQDDPSAMRVNRLRNLSVRRDLSFAVERSRLIFHAPFEIGRKAPGYYERGAPTRALAIKARKLVKALGMGLETGMHRAHHNAVRQCDGSDLQRLG
jgi:hypothetical protein